MIYPHMPDEVLEATGLASLVVAPAADTSPSCAGLGCHPSRGQLKCEFHPRRNKDDKKSRAAVTNGKRNRRPPRWKMFCPGERLCLWQLNYYFGDKSKMYRLQSTNHDHEGHTIDPPSTDVMRLLSTSDMTDGMWTKLCQLVTIRIGGLKLREVSTQSHHSLTTAPPQSFTSCFVVTTQLAGSLLTVF